MRTDFETHADIDGDGTLVLSDVPFPAGTRVAVVVRPVAPPSDDPYPLRGRPLRYDAPFDGVAEDDWDALPTRP